MRRLPWVRGPAAASGTVFVSATRFTYRSQLHMPFVFGHGLLLRSRWRTIDGAVGMCTAGSLLTRSTYTVSVWAAEASLNRWLESTHHARLMRDYKGYLESSAAVSWLTDSFHPRTAWSEAMSRLGVDGTRPTTPHRAIPPFAPPS